jgi:hypothetical protein
MASKPNYRRDRLERDRAARARYAKPNERHPKSLRRTNKASVPIPKFA